jgi:hypothetical protein
VLHQFDSFVVAALLAPQYTEHLQRRKSARCSREKVQIEALGVLNLALLLKTDGLFEKGLHLDGCHHSIPSLWKRLLHSY